jgi:hypothetical protein
MNTIDMRFGATVGMGNIGVENVQSDGVRGEKRGEDRGEELPSELWWETYRLSETECGFADCPSLLP